MYRGVHPVFGVCALKCIRLKQLDRHREIQGIERECAILKSLHHPAIVNLVAYIEKPEHYWIVLEYCGLGDFEKFS